MASEITEEYGLGEINDGFSRIFHGSFFMLLHFLAMPNDSGPRWFSQLAPAYITKSQETGEIRVFCGTVTGYIAKLIDPKDFRKLMNSTAVARQDT